MESEEFSIYFYNPSLAASAVFTILYFLTSLFHLYMTVIFPRPGRHHRARHFIPLLIGAFLEVAGYAIRCGSIQDTSSIPLYAVSATLIVIGPVFVCASLYMLMDRLIWPETEGEISEKPESFLFIRVQRRWLPRIFVTLDVISCLVQASGSGIAASGNWEGSEKDTGTGVLIGGLVLQVVTFVAFLLIVGSFNFKNRDQDIPDGAKQLIVGIYISCLLYTSPSPRD